MAAFAPRLSANTLTMRGDCCDGHRAAEQEDSGVSAAQERMAQARARLTAAKDAWTRCAVMALRGEAGAPDLVAPALRELTEARVALVELNRQAIEEART